MSRFIGKLENIPTKIKKVLSCVFLFASLVFLFPAGIFSSNVNVEVAASYIADVAKNHTNDGKFVSMIVESANEDEKKLNSAVSEFYSLNDMFCESKPAFASTVNADKKNNVYFSDIVCQTNLSFLYVFPAGFSNKEYGDHWKQEVYPFELMFKGNHSCDGVFSFFYISKSHADLFLEKEGLEKTKENYESLIGKKTYLKFNNNDFLFSIADIYLETGYYYEALNQVMGDFLISYNKYPDGFNKQALFFLNEHEYQNKYYFNYAKTNYPRSDFNYSFGTYNLKDNYSIDTTIANKMFDVTSGVGSILLLILSIILVSISLFIIIKNDFAKNWKLDLVYLGTLFAPYLIFKIIFVITGNVTLFSDFSTISNTIFIIAFIVGMLCYLAIRNIKARKDSKNAN